MASAVSIVELNNAALPRAITPLLGREGELDQVLALIEVPANRLVTILGPGGVGKTRLAVHVASTLVDEFDRDVAFVSLAAIRDPSLVLPAIAQALGIAVDGPGTIEDKLLKGLRERDLLLILDNVEQVLTAGPGIANLLARAPGLTVLITSRAALGIPGEQRFPLEPLPTPAPDQTSTEAILAADAVALFVARARAVNPRLAIDDQNARTIGDICRRLDGLPLAIELAAARSAILSPPALLARLENRLSVLGGDRSGVPDRLRTMRNAIAWSYDLLDPVEQALFRRLAVFVGGFPLDAAEAVAASIDGRLDPLNALGTLVDHSLLQTVAESTPDPRYLMLETLREFGLERLEAAGEVEVAQGDQAMWVARLVQAAEAQLTGPRQMEWLDRLDAEWGNIRLACSWANASGHPDISLSVFGSIWRFCSSRGHTTESRALLDQALAATSDLETALRSHALIAAGSFAEDQRDMEVARALLTEARDLAARIGNHSDVVRALIMLAHEAHDRADYTAATEANSQAISLATRIGDRRSLAGALGAMGNVNYFQGKLEEASRSWEEARQLVSALGDLQAEAFLLGNLGAVALELGQFERGAQLEERSLGLARQINDLPAMANALMNLAEHVRFLGDFARAEQLMVEGLQIVRALGYRGTEGQALHMYASLVLAQGDARRAASLLLGSVDRFREIEDQRNLSESADLLSEICLAEGKPGASIELMAAADALRQAIGVDPGPHKVRELAGLRARLHRAVPKPEFDRHWRAGGRLDFHALASRMIEVIQEIGDTGPESPTPPAPANPLDALTSREREVMRLLIDGRSAREIGEALFISPRTVTTHINNMYGKLGVSTRAQAVAMALRAGLDTSAQAG